MPTKSDEVAKAQGSWFDEAAALKVKNFIETYCVLSDGKRYGEKVQVLDWVYDDIICPLYGEKIRNSEGQTENRYHRGSCWCGKKQSKSSTLAFLALFDVCSEAGAEVYILSSTIESASTIFRYAANCVELSPALNKRFRISHHLKKIEDRSRKSFLKVLSGKGLGKQGQHALSIYFDELADLPDHSLEAWQGLYHAGMARADRFKMFAISTPQYNRKSIGYEEYRYCKSVRDSEVVDTQYLPLIYGVPEEADYTDENQWWDNLPSIGVIVGKDYYRKEWARAKDNPRMLAEFRTKLIGQWVEQLDCWIPESTWNKCHEDFQEEDFHGMDVYVGIDPARYSLSAYVLLVPIDGKVYVLPRYFCPQETAEKEEKKYKTPYRQWAAQGLLTLTDGDVFDPEAMRNSIVADSKKFNFLDLAWDGYNFLESQQILLNDHQLELVEVPSTMAGVGEATVMFEQLCHNQSLIHNGHPILTWNVKNVAIRSDNQDRVLVDRNKSTGRYDGVSATIVALARYLNNPQYDCGGIEVVAL